MNNVKTFNSVVEAVVCPSCSAAFEMQYLDYHFGFCPVCGENLKLKTIPKTKINVEGVIYGPYESQREVA